MRVLKPISIDTIDVFLYQYVHVKNKTSRLSRRLREHVSKQIEVAKGKGWIKEEDGKIFKKKFEKDDIVQDQIQKEIDRINNL